MKSVNDAADLFLSKTLILMHVLHLATMQLFRAGINIASRRIHENEPKVTTFMP
jgi:hypothetical protein